MSHQEGLGSSARARIYDITGLQVQHLLAKLDVLLEYLPFPLPLEEILSPGDFTQGEASGGKHTFQEASILGHLRRIGVIGNDLTTTARKRAIELGAGTGRLSDRLSRVTQASLDHILIDRQEFSEAQTRDRILRARAKSRNHNPCPMIERIVLDIASLDLDDYLLDDDRSCFCMSKHLCGPACDLAIASLGRLKCNRLPVCAVATCCHYLCTWESFSGKDFWISLGLSEDDFLVAVSASQWASLKSAKKMNQDVPVNTSCLLYHSQTHLGQLSEAAETAASALHASDNGIARVITPSEEFEKSFSREEKVALGITLKQILDLARAARLQEMGYDVRLVRYTTRSLEDRLLVATPKTESRIKRKACGSET